MKASPPRSGGSPPSSPPGGGCRRRRPPWPCARERAARAAGLQTGGRARRRVGRPARQKEGSGRGRGRGRGERAERATWAVQAASGRRSRRHGQWEEGGGSQQRRVAGSRVRHTLPLSSAARPRTHARSSASSVPRFGRIGAQHQRSYAASAPAASAASACTAIRPLTAPMVGHTPARAASWSTSCASAARAACGVLWSVSLCVCVSLVSLCLCVLPLCRSSAHRLSIASGLLDESAVSQPPPGRVPYLCGVPAAAGACARLSSSLACTARRRGPAPQERTAAAWARRRARYGSGLAGTPRRFLEGS